MKREAKLLLNKAYDSLVLSIELFNRPYDRGRISSTLILLDHAFEMLLKSSIIHRGGRIREKRSKETIGFDACLRVLLTNSKIKCSGFRFKKLVLVQACDSESFKKLCSVYICTV